MVIASIPTQSPEVTVRFTGPWGTCIDGIDYGPNHVDAPVTLPRHIANEFIRRGRAKLDRRPVIVPPPVSEPEGGDGPDASEPRRKRRGR